MQINGETKIVGVIGFPIEHTASPLMHNAAFQHLGLNYIYLPFLVKPGELKKAVEGLKALNVKGFNVTIPYKNEVANYVDELKGEASFIHSVNTVVREGDRFIGYSTDGEGFMKSLEEEGIKIKGKSVLIIGAGGASTAISFSLLKEGISSLYIINRGKERGEKLRNLLLKIYPNSPIHFFPLERKVFPSLLPEVDILINSTPIGMREGDPLLFNPDFLPSHTVICDIVYKPLYTPLIEEAKKRGNKVVTGLGMLLHQGAIAFRLWTGVEPPLEVMKEALYKALSSAKNKD